MEDAEQGGRRVCLRAAFVEFARRNAVLAAVGARTRYLGVLHVHLVRAAGLHAVDQLQSLRYAVYLLYLYKVQILTLCTRASAMSLIRYSVYLLYWYHSTNTDT